MVSMSTVEQILPSVYIRFLFFYSLPKDYNKDETLRILREGFDATLKAIPMLNSEMLLDAESPQQGKRTTRLASGPFEHFYETDYRDDPVKFPWSFEQFKEEGFPTAPLLEELFVPQWPMLPDFTTPMPTFGVQTSFIEGGLVVGYNFSHGKYDARSIYEIMRVWSQNCRDLQEGSSPSVLSLNPEVFDNSAMTRGLEGVEVKSHSEYITIPEPTIPPAFLRDDFRTRIYHFSPHKLEQLKKDCSPTDGSYWISTNDALSALLWSSIVATQVDRTNLPEVSYNTTCTDGRLRTHPKMSIHHIGSAMVMNTPHAPMETVLARDLKTLAYTIRQALNAMTPEYMDNLVTYFNSVPDFRVVIPPSLAGFMDHSSYMTAWHKIPFYEVNWGPFMGGHCKSIRTLNSGYFNGTCVTLPTPDNRGVDVIMGLDHTLFDQFDKDETWHKYAEFRC